MLASLVTAAALAASPHCGLTHPELCRNTNVLVADRAFVRALRTFVGVRRVAYLHPGSAADQQMEVLGGPPDEPARIGERYRFTACRPHSCDEKGAVVLEAGGRIVASGVLHAPSDCLGPRRPDDCTRRFVLTLFVRNPGGERGVIDDLTAWATEKAAAAYVDQWTHPRLEAVELYAAGAGTPKRISITRLARD